MKYSIDDIDDGIAGKVGQIALRRTKERQANGEIRTANEVAAQLGRTIDAVETRGRVTTQLAVPYGAVLPSDEVNEFASGIKDDAEILFNAVDSVDAAAGRIASVVDCRLRSVEYSLGRLRSELADRQTRLPAGSGWSAIVRDSFECGYAQLEARDDLPAAWLDDPRAGGRNGRAVIKADAKVDGIGRKLVLPATDDGLVGFKTARVSVVENSGNVDFGLSTDPSRAVDGDDGTFWYHVVGSTAPLVGTDYGWAITQVTGPAGRGIKGPYGGTIFSVDPSGDLGPQIRRDFYLVATGPATYRCLASLDDRAEVALCRWNDGDSCRWGYSCHASGCANAACARYDAGDCAVAKGYGPLLDGCGNDTGFRIKFVDALIPGQAWRLSLHPYGNVGPAVELALDLKRPGAINWLELDPVVCAPFRLEKLEYSTPGSSTRSPILAGPVEVSDRLRLDFAPVEAGTVYLTLRQPTGKRIDAVLPAASIAVGRLLEMRAAAADPTIAEFHALPLEDLVREEAQGLDRRMFDGLESSREFHGYAYALGAFEVSCGLASYAESALAVTKSVELSDPRMFAVDANLEADFAYAVAASDLGTAEWDVLRSNYDASGALLGAESFPIPQVDAAGYVTERVFLGNDRTGPLRFAADAVDSVRVPTIGRTLAATEWNLSSSTIDGVPTSTLTVARADVGPSAIVVIRYRPRTGVRLAAGSSAVLADNAGGRLSLSDRPFVVLTDGTCNGRAVDHADVRLRAILRRNDPDVYVTPGIRDYRLCVSESDPARFI